MTLAPSMNVALGSPPTLEWVALASLLVDADYQRSIENKASEGLIRKIARFWDWGLAQPLAVARRADGSLWVIDGQHRLSAAKLRGDIPHLPCVVQRPQTVGDEAAMFVALNRNRRALTAADLFTAGCAAGDEDCLAVAKLIADAGLSLAKHQNYIAWKPGQIYHVSGVLKAYRTYGRLVTSAALVALGEAFSGQILRFAATILEGLFGVYASETAKTGSFDPDLFLEVLAAGSQADWVGDAKKRVIDLDEPRSAAMTNAMLSAYAEAAALGDD